MAGTRVSGTRSALVAAFGAALLGLLAFSSTYAIVGLTRGPTWVSPLVGVGVGLVAFAGLVTAVRRFGNWLAQIVSSVAGPGDEDVEEGAEDVGVDDVYEHEDSLFLVHALVNDIARETFKEIRSTTLEVYAPDTLLVYPEPSNLEDEDEEGLYEPAEPEGVDATMKGKRLTVRLDSRYFILLAGVVERGEGEVAVVDDEDELRAVYAVAKAIAQSAIDDEAFAAYTAYKALLRMMRARRLSVPERLRGLLPFEERDLKVRVRQQVAEEGISPEGSRSPPL